MYFMKLNKGKQLGLDYWSYIALLSEVPKRKINVVEIAC